MPSNSWGERPRASVLVQPYKPFGSLIPIGDCATCGFYKNCIIGQIKERGFFCDSRQFVVAVPLSAPATRFSNSSRAFRSSSSILFRSFMFPADRALSRLSSPRPTMTARESQESQHSENLGFGTFSAREWIWRQEPVPNPERRHQDRDNRRADPAIPRREHYRQPDCVIGILSPRSGSSSLRRIRAATTASAARA